VIGNVDEPSRTFVEKVLIVPGAFACLRNEALRAAVRGGAQSRRALFTVILRMWTGAASAAGATREIPVAAPTSITSTAAFEDRDTGIPLYSTVTAFRFPLTMPPSNPSRVLRRYFPQVAVVLCTAVP